MKKFWVIVCALLLSASTARADVVAEWNVIAGQSINSGARRGPSGLIDFAMVHAAMHDAVQAYQGRFEPYCGAVPNASGSPAAAAAAAAHAVLVALFPLQKETLDLAYGESVGKYGAAGATTGQLAAACVLGRLAADDTARAQPDTFVGSQAAGAWRSAVPLTAQFLCTLTPFALKGADQFRASQEPPPLTSGAYAKAYDEVKNLGALSGSTRTEAQTKIGRFFAAGPPGYWNGALRSLAGAHLTDIGDSARLFALVNMAMADAIITSWDSKLAFGFWRPITAIQNGHADGNPRTVGDPTWQPLVGPTPNYPDYTSGANNLSGAATTMLANFFGTDEMAFSLASNTIAAPDNVRDYTRFSDAARDVVDARIYMGIHFRFADTVALRQGTHVANWIFSHFMRPIGDTE
jgi:hypothetical protein